MLFRSPDEYVAWYKDVAANIASVLAEDGSYFLNIKEHADEGERNLYVKDLVIAHRREWAWRVKRGESLKNLEAFAAFADPEHRPDARP